MNLAVPQRPKSLEIFICAWIVAAQVWYYLQFSAQFRPIIQATLRKLWH
jgi:hypothetical protein